MRNWKTRFDLRDVWGQRNGECGPEEWTDKTVHELAKEISRRIKRKFPQHMIDGHDWDPRLTEVQDMFESVPTLKEHRDMLARLIANENVCDDEICEMSKDTPMTQFNEAMDLFYDWCDSSSVWVDK
uniref:Uncharacterized protein n=1 Tax=Salmonella phage SalP219 TaxID=3158864 RepID=A0AAU7PI89_9CAUD